MTGVGTTGVAGAGDAAGGSGGGSRAATGGTAGAPGSGLLGDLGRLIGRLPAPAGTASTRVAVVVVAIGIAGDALLRSGAATVATGLFAVVLTAGLWWARLWPARASRATGVAGVLFALFAVVRTSPWLVPLDLLAAAGLITLACSIARGGRLADLGAAALTQRVARLAASAVRGPAWLRRSYAAPAPRSGRARRAGAVARGLLLAAPLLLVLGALLASSDVVFAHLLTPDLDAGPVAGHVVLAVVSAWIATALCADAASAEPPSWQPRRRPLGAMEGATILASLVALFAVFCATQVVALNGGADRVLAAAGLTRAEYARDGFFQLLWVAAITLGVLGTLRAVTHSTSDRARQVLRRLTQAAVLLTLVIVAVAVRRLALYTDAFGLTMLRLYSTLFAIWIGVVFMALAGAVHGVRADRNWVLPFAAASGLALLAVLNVVNVEAQVARSNLGGEGPAGQTDLRYLAHDLSSDAVPTLLEHAQRLDDEGAALRELVCASRPQHDAPASPLEWNWSRMRAAAAAARACPR